MNSELAAVLKDGIAQIDSGLLQTDVLHKLEKYYDNLKLFNPSLKLVAADDNEIVCRHILDSLAPVNIIKEQMNYEKPSFADLGSGNGMPGLVLSCALEDVSFDLVERMGRRAGFLRNTVAVTGLVNKTAVVEKNLDCIDSKYGNVVFRAFRPLSEICRDIDRITEKESRVFIYKSSEDNINSDIDAMRRYNCELFDFEAVSYPVPYLNAKRTMLVLKHR